jgi:iron(III) transport system permease protein
MTMPRITVNWPLLQNSFVVASVATVLAILLGQMMAVWISCSGIAMRRCLLLVTVVVLVLPPFLVVNAWIDLFGTTGSFHLWLPFELYSPTGTVVLLALMHWPITTLLVYSSWRQLDPELSEIDPELSGLPFFKDLLLPGSRMAMAQSAALVFVLAMNQFSIPAILQVKVYPAELWVQFNTTFNSVEALKLSWPMLVFPLLLIALLARKPISWPQGLREWNHKNFRRLIGSFRWVAISVSTGLIVLAFVLPLGQLVFSAGTWAHLSSAFAAGQGAFWQSLILAAGAAVLVLFLGWPASRSRWGALMWPFFFLPGVLIGILLIFLLNRNATHGVYSSVTVLFIGLTLRYFAPAWYGARLIRRGMDRDLVDTGRLGGASGWQRWRLVDWPLVRSQMLALAYVIYLLCLWDVETISLIVPAGGETLALRIFNLLHYGHNEQVNALCLLLLLVAVIPLMLGMTVSFVAARLRKEAV